MIQLKTILLVFLWCGGVSIYAQNNISSHSNKLANKNLKIKKSAYGKNNYFVIPKNQLTSDLRQQFLEKGAKIKATYPDGNVVIQTNNEAFVKRLNLGTTNTGTFNEQQKLSPELAKEGKISVAISFFDNMTTAELSHLKNDFGITDNELSIAHRQIMIGDIDASMLKALAELPEVAFVSPLEEAPVPLNDNLISYHQGGAITNANGTALQGKGVVIGVGDGGKLGKHIDLEGRIYDEAYGTYDAYGDHGDKVAGIIAGAGNIDERNRGYAPKAHLVTQKTFRIFYYLEKYYKKYGMRLTNNSYGAHFHCITAGAYNYYSRMLDDQQVQFADVLHVVAAGNSGTATCNNYPTGYGTVLGTYASAKNVLTVGGVNANGTLSSISGRGPAKDGRLKPEIVTQIEGITSTSNNNNYGGFGATSAAAPSATGGAALVYEAYKKKTGKNPEGALLKAILCNTANDVGNQGPDYSYGFGVMNLKKAIKNVEDGGYMLGSVSASNTTQTFTINVPTGQRELKVMLAWSDVSQPIDNVATLMNDLNLTVTSPEGTSYNPWILNHQTDAVANPATRGEDNINNMEQVTIPTPAAGTYTITVQAKKLSTTSQKFAVSHILISNDIQLTFPTAGMSITPNESVLVSWDADLDNVTGYNLEYTIDNGTTWTSIGTASAAVTSHVWTVPDIHSSKAQVRVTAQGANKFSISERFNILASPSNLQLNAMCKNYVNLTWDTTPNASSYEIYQFKGNEMTLIGTSNSNKFLVEERLDVGKTYWFSIKAKYPSGETSRRTIAKSVVASGTSPCPWANDVSITSLSGGNKKGRKLTSSSLAQNQAIQFTVKNVGNNTVSNISIKLTVDGLSHQEIINTSLTSGDSIVYQAPNTYDFSTEGTHTVLAEATVAEDTRQGLGTIGENFVQLANAPVELPASGNIHDKPELRIFTSQLGVENFVELDFETNGSGVLIIGEQEGIGKVLSVLQNSYNDSSRIYITQNINSNKEVFLGMNYKIKSLSTNSGVDLEMRLSDTDAWISLQKWKASQDWQSDVQKINLRKVANDAGKDFSSSTQFRFVMYGNIEFAMSEFLLEEKTDVLPVEMEYFKAFKAENNAVLEWRTASEENNDFFEIQVATKEDFMKDKFQTIGKIQGRGTTLDPQDYVFIDRTPLKSGTRYYRLKQVDFDRTTAYTEVRYLQFEELENKEFAVSSNMILEEGTVSVAFSLPKEGEVSYTLTSVSGVVIYARKQNFSTGTHLLKIGFPPTLPAGIYYLSTTLNGTHKPITVPLVKS